MYRIEYKTVEFLRDSTIRILALKQKLSIMKLTLSATSDNIHNLLQHHMLQLLKENIVFSSIGEAMKDIVSDENCKVYKRTVEQIIRVLVVNENEMTQTGNNASQLKRNKN